MHNMTSVRAHDGCKVEFKLCIGGPSERQRGGVEASTLAPRKFRVIVAMTLCDMGWAGGECSRWCSATAVLGSHWPLPGCMVIALLVRPGHGETSQSPVERPGSMCVARR